MNNAKREELIRNFIDAYNRMDVEQMLESLEENVVFINRVQGETNLTLEGKNAFRKQAESALKLFSDRRQSILSIAHLTLFTKVAIRFFGILNVNYSNELLKGDALNLKAVSWFYFGNAGIVKIVDETDQ